MNKPRFSSVRLKIEEYLASEYKPFSAMEMVAFLHKHGLEANKTTVYRQLESMLTEGLLQEVQLGDSIVRYEPKHDQCHHHVVCNNCGKVEHVELGSEITDLQKKLSKQTGIDIQEHMLEFFGVCENCK